MARRTSTSRPRRYAVTSRRLSGDLARVGSRAAAAKKLDAAPDERAEQEAGNRCGQRSLDLGEPSGGSVNV